MNTRKRLSVMLAGPVLASLLLATLPALGQDPGAAPKPDAAPKAAASKPATEKPSLKESFTFAATYTYTFAKASTKSESEYYGIQGGSVEAVYSLGQEFNFGRKYLGSLWDGVGVVVKANGESASGISPGIDLNQVTVVAGPRYTWRYNKPRPIPFSLFGQGLFGYVHAWDTLFPSTPPAAGGVYTPKTNASAFAMQAGGGVNVPYNKHLGFRVAEAEWVYTQLPNHSNDWQSDIRLSSGVTFRF